MKVLVDPPQKRQGVILIFEKADVSGERAMMYGNMLCYLSYIYC
jgi:hypothetical protein